MEMVRCKVCKKEFIKKRKDNLYCSNNCVSRQYRVNHPERYREQWMKHHKKFYENESLLKANSRRRKQSNYGHTPRGRYSSYKTASRVRSLKFILTFEEFMSFWNKPCGYCGDEVKGIGIDRKNSEEGYTLNNCISCCEICNRMKLHYSIEYFLLKCEQIVNFNSKRNTTVEA